MSSKNLDSIKEKPPENNLNVTNQPEAMEIETHAKTNTSTPNRSRSSSRNSKRTKSQIADNDTSEDEPIAEDKIKNLSEKCAFQARKIQELSSTLNQQNERDIEKTKKFDEERQRYDRRIENLEIQLNALTAHANFNPYTILPSNTTTTSLSDSSLANTHSAQHTITTTNANQSQPLVTAPNTTGPIEVHRAHQASTLINQRSAKELDTHIQSHNNTPTTRIGDTQHTSRQQLWPSLPTQPQSSSSINTPHTGINNTNNTNIGSKKFVVSKPINNKQISTKVNTGIKFKINRDIPELIIYEIENAKSFLSELKSLLNHDKFLLKTINKDKTALYTDSLDDRNTVRKFLDDNDARYFTYTPKGEKPVSCLVKYIDSSFDEGDVRPPRGIDAMGHGVEVLSLRIHGSKSDTRSNIWLVQLKNENNKHKLFLGKQFLCSSVVKVEIFKSESLTQCRRCQRYNHSAINCKQEYRCVKCGKSESEKDENNLTIGHPPKTCPLDALKVDGKIEPKDLFCCNCRQSGHTANYRKCSKYTELVNRQIEKSESQKKKSSERAGAIFDSSVEKGISFADRLKSPSVSRRSRSRSRNTNNARDRSRSTNIIRDRSKSASSRAPQNHSNPSNFNFLNSQCQKHFRTNITSIISEVNKFIPEYKSASEELKPVKLLEFIIGISSK